MNFPETLAAVRHLSQKWPGALAKFIEDAANGTAVIQTLQHEISGIIAVPPLGGKLARARAVSPLVLAGNVYLPHPEFVGQWVWDFIEEHAAFPRGRYDDWVDAMSQALQRLMAAPLVPMPHRYPYDEDDEEPPYFP